MSAQITHLFTEADLRLILNAEREEIAKLLESMTTEWRSGPPDNKDGLPRKHPRLSGAGVVEIPTNQATPAEVWVLERAAFRVRSRSTK